MTTVTLDLPRQIYQKAAQIAKATRRPIEQVVVDWIQPLAESMRPAGETALAGMDAMSTAQLTQVARSTARPEDTEHLRKILSLQGHGELNVAERDEAVRLVEQEDTLTLRKAKAIYLLKQRNALPDELADLLR